ncbi:hypothetical protein EDD21DRAFT_109595 [Dissophora ornata]|nr:hypothetical protein BGZ58_006961 [Dissophora ornata]KAI8601357.1 hypothetical protein EDD21DRAFT_109595 [Dissophora ornata]
MLGDIPELLHVLGKYLNTRDLVACLQVSTLWNKVFTEHLWRTIDDSQRPWRRLLSYFSEPIATFYYPEQFTARSLEPVPEPLLELFVKYGHHIRNLVIRRPHTIEVCVLAEARARAMAQQMEEVGTNSEGIGGAGTETRTGSGSASSPVKNIPCCGLVKLRFDFTLSTLGLIDDLDGNRSLSSPALSTLSATIIENQEKELLPAIEDVPVDIFRPKSGTWSSPRPSHAVTLARSSWKLIRNNPKLQVLYMRSLSSLTMPKLIPTARDFVLATIAGLPRLRSLQANFHQQEDFLAMVPTILPQLEMLCYMDPSKEGFDRLLIADPESRFESNCSLDADGIHNYHKDTLSPLRSLQVTADIHSGHLRAILSTFPRLKRLSMENLLQNDSKGSPIYVHTALHTVLERLSVKRWDDLAITDILFPAVKDFTLIRVAGIRNLLKILHLFPGLERFRLCERRRQPEEAPVDFRTERPLPITAVILYGDGFHEEILVNGFLSLMPHLVSVQLDKAYPSTVRLLAQQCPSLESLEFLMTASEVVSDTSKELGALFSSCERLRCCMGPGLVVDANEVATQGNNWICRRLQRLSFGVVGIPRLTKQQQAILDHMLQRLGITLSTLGTDVENFLEGSCTEEESFIWRQYQECKRLQQAVYQRLGQFTELYELDLGLPLQLASDNEGVEDRYERLVSESLELTLASGLGHMSRLGKLRILGICRVDQRLLGTEIKWMKGHWPCLKVVRCLNLDGVLCNIGLDEWMLRMIPQS